MKSPEEFKKILKQLPGISINTCFYRFMKIGYLKDPLSGLGSLEHGGRLERTLKTVCLLP